MHDTSGIIPRALALALAVLAGACAKNDEERRFEALAGTCAGLGSGTTTYLAAKVALSGSYPAGPFCSAALAAMPEGDGCGAAAPGREICQVLQVWFSTDSKACPNGHCTCELRLLRSALDAQGQDAAVCGARFDREGAEP
jgi:hypothetical protein